MENLVPACLGSLLDRRLLHRHARASLGKRVAGEWRGREDGDDEENKIVIHVAPGTYVGSYTNIGARIEPLPIRLDVSNLELIGSTSMKRDESGLPTGAIEPGSNTLLLADPPLVGLSGQTLLVVGSAVDEVIGRVTDAKLRLDTRAIRPRAGGNIEVDHVQGFMIRDNYLTTGGEGRGAGGQGIFVVRSSGQILGNYTYPTGRGNRSHSGKFFLALVGARARESLPEQPGWRGRSFRRILFAFARGFALRGHLRKRSQRQ